MARTISYTEAIREALDEELQRDDRVFIMGEDVGAFGGLWQTCAGLQQKYGRRRVINTPISEALIAGAGVGAAIVGLRPVVDLMFADFVSVAMDEIFNKAAKWRYMHGGLFTVPLVIRAASGAAGGAGAEHSQCPEGLFLGAAGLYVLTPSTPADAKGLLKSAIRDDNPVLFIEHKMLYYTSGPVPDGDYLVPIGKADVKREGTDVTVVAWSNMVLKALEAAEALAAEGISVEVIDPRGTRPLDIDTILKSVEKTGRLVTAHEAPTIGGPGSEVAATVAEKALDLLAAPIVRVGPPDTPIPQSLMLEQLWVPSTANIVAAVKKVVAA